MSGAANLRLVCRPSKAGNVLLFPYTLDNQGQTDVYAMHALPSADPDSGEARANETAATVIAGPEGEAIVGKFAAPLPVDRRIAVPVVPLARHVPPGGSIEGSIEIPLPLAETSPYFADLSLRRYEVIDIRAVVLTIGYWLGGRDNLVAVPVDYAPDLFFVVNATAAKSALRVTQRFPTSGLQMFRRTDQYPRSLG
jgi:hypothetical protein